ncbi:MAG: lysophospholipid acyltransferase family protein [Sphingomicrobium sp.]
MRGIFISLYRLHGWHFAGTRPAARKFVLVGAPHTSNWDFAAFLGATHQLGIAPGFMGKHSLFRWPMRRFMTDMGGIPVDRSKRTNYVEQMVAEFARRDELALVVAPEGTRDSDGRWRSGFYHIALGAGVPIVPAWIDRAQRRGAIGPAIMPSGDYRRDLAKLAAFYRAIQPDQPRFAQIDRDDGATDRSTTPADALGGAA